MAEAALAQRTVAGAVRPPPRPVLWAIAGAACVAAALTLTFTLTSDHVTEPSVQAALMTWASLAYVVAGLVAWRQRPESRIGVLMLAAGCATFLASWSSANASRGVRAPDGARLARHRHGDHAARDDAARAAGHARAADRRRA